MYLVAICARGLTAANCSCMVTNTRTVPSFGSCLTLSWLGALVNLGGTVFSAVREESDLRETRAGRDGAGDAGSFEGSAFGVVADWKKDGVLAGFACGVREKGEGLELEGSASAMLDALESSKEV